MKVKAVLQVHRFAEKGEKGRVLEQVRVRDYGNRVEFAATDRYVLTETWIDYPHAKAHEAVERFVPAKALKALAARARKGSGMVIAPEGVVLTEPDTRKVLEVAPWTDSEVVGVFPAIDRLWPKGDRVAGAPEACLDVARLAELRFLFADKLRDVRLDSGAGGTGLRPVVVTPAGDGETWRALIAPTRR